MPDLRFRVGTKAREQLLHYRQARRGAVPLDLERKMSSETQIYARRRRFSAAC
jgi:hypothetical protein